MGAVLILSGRSRAEIEVSSGPDNGIVVVLTETDRSALAAGDSLRKAHKHDEAIAAYREALETKKMEPHVRAECEYNIGISYTWLGRYEDAEAAFKSIRTTYADDPDAVGYAEYCLAWIEVQMGQYREAIGRLEQSLNKGSITDRELAARTHFMIGRTYLLFLDDRESAAKIIKEVKELYADTSIISHPYLENL